MTFVAKNTEPECVHDMSIKFLRQQIEWNRGSHYDYSGPPFPLLIKFVVCSKCGHKRAIDLVTKEEADKGVPHGRD